MKDAAQDVAGDVSQDVRKDLLQDLASGARAARALLATSPPPPPQSLRSSRLAEIGAQLGSSVAFGSGCCGQALSGLPRKAPLCSSTAAGAAAPTGATKHGANGRGTSRRSGVRRGNERCGEGFEGGGGGGGASTTAKTNLLECHDKRPSPELGLEPANNQQGGRPR